MARRYRIVQEEFDKRGKAFGPQPLRREVLVADTDRRAIDEHVRVAQSLPVDPLLLRPQWPTMDADETTAAIKRLGREVLPTLLRLEPAVEIAMG